jgi:hypothetical protein
MTTPATITPVCRRCEMSFSPKRSDQIFCSEQCRNKHHANLLKESGRCMACGEVKTSEKRFCDPCLRLYADTAKLRNENRRRRVIEHYGDRCTCCGEKEFDFLCIDHIEGGGNKHRASINYSNVYAWLITHDFPFGFQTLCHNCNMAKGIHGTCPHKRKPNASA